MLQRRNGFSLIELAVVLVVIGVVVGVGLNFGSGLIEEQQRTGTEEKTKLVQEALQQYYDLNGRMPCPANETLERNDPNFGKEAVDANNNCTFDVFDSGDAISVGAVPVRTLGIPDSLAIDEYNNRFTYVIDNDMVDEDAAKTAQGDIIIKDGNDNDITTEALFFLTSHGADGQGAVNDKNPSVARDCDDVEGKDAKNCKKTSDTDTTTFRQTKVNDGDIASEQFDDNTVWGTAETVLKLTAAGGGHRSASSERTAQSD